MSDSSAASSAASAAATDLIDFIAASPSPRHAVAEAIRRLSSHGFSALDTGAELADRGWAARAGSLIAWRRGPAEGPVRVITAHTDSPNLRIKPQPDTTSVGLHQLGVETYGGALLNSWLDRDLGIAGHVVLKSTDGVEERLVLIDRPVMRVPQLAIHLDREINQKGLLLNKQQHLAPMWGTAATDSDADKQDADDGNDAAADTGFRALLGAELGCEPDAILSWELMAHPIEPPALGGWHDEFLAAPRIDNQLSCWASIEALIAADGDNTMVVALFDHEEVGSTSATGADSGLLLGVLDALVVDTGAALNTRSLCVSADCAHATHPNYADRHEPDHRIALNGGPVVKINANERYATTAMGHALFAQACEAADVPHQVFVNRSDLACGSTVGPLTAARTGLETVDVGAPQLAMHSARETTGAADPGFLKAALTQVLNAG